MIEKKPVVFTWAMSFIDGRDGCRIWMRWETELGGVPRVGDEVRGRQVIQVDWWHGNDVELEVHFEEEECDNWEDMLGRVRYLQGQGARVDWIDPANKEEWGFPDDII